MLPPGPLLLAALPPAPPAVVLHETSAEWRAALAGRLPVLVQTAPPNPADEVRGSEAPELAEYPDYSLPIGVEVVGDVVTPDGHWSQTVRLTIKSGGTMGDASQAVYGNILHVDELFRAAQRLDPSIQSPARIHIGQEIELTVDPTRAFILQNVAVDDQKIVRTFANGVRETVYRKPSTSVARLVEFPRAPNGAGFAFPDGANRVSVPSGGRAVDYSYRPGDDYAGLVRESAGVATYKAAADVTRQTGWEPAHWPPKPGETKRVILESPDRYQPEPLKALEVAPPSPDARAAFDQLAQGRQRVGIYPFQQLSSGIVYRVMVEDTTATARDVSRLIYGDDQEYLAIAQKAGFAVPQGAAAQGFNPRLFGTSFDISVDYAREYFPYSDEHDATAKARIVKLLNGTVVERFDAAQTDGHGVWEITRYPNGYKRVVYRPNGVMLTIGNALAYVRGIQDLGLDDTTAQSLRRRYAGEFLWNWSLNVPREPGDIPDSFDIQKVGNADVLVVSIGPSAPLTHVESLLDRLWNRSPLLNVVAVTLVGAIAVVLVGLFAGRGPRTGREM